MAQQKDYLFQHHLQTWYVFFYLQYVFGFIFNLKLKYSTLIMTYEKVKYPKQ